LRATEPRLRFMREAPPDLDPDTLVATLYERFERREPQAEHLNGVLHAAAIGCSDH